MAPYILTGEQETQTVVGAAGVVANVSAIGAASDLYLRPYIATDEPIVGSHRSRPSNMQVSVETNVQVVNRRLFRSLLDTAAKHATELEEATHDEDAYIDRGAAGHELLRCLQELWLLRDLREREWKQLLASMQSSLFNAIFESFTPLQGHCVKTLVVDYLSDSVMTKDRVARAIRILRKAQFDVWKGLSVPPTDD